MLRVIDITETPAVRNRAHALVTRRTESHRPIRWQMQPGDPATTIAKTDEPSRWDDWTDVPGVVAAFIREELGVRSSVGCPIFVKREFWGALTVHSRQDAPLPEYPELLIAQFNDVVATGIADARAQAELACLADEQAAMRRVATLVAEGVEPGELFAAVAREVGRLLSVDHAYVTRFDTDDGVTVCAGWLANGEPVPVALPRRYRAGPMSEQIRETGGPARLDPYPGDPGAEALERGVRSAVSVPITIEGRLWGFVSVASTREEPPPPETEARLSDFTALVATAIANAESREQLAASRARLVTAADEARRRVVRDLHDGAQQRLVLSILTLKLAQRAFGEGGGNAEALVGDALQHAEQGNVELRELARGVPPAVLARGGLRAGVDAVASRLGLPVRVDIPAERLPSAVEANAYFIVAEALTNVVKHSQATQAEVRASMQGGVVRVEVQDDGIGGADPEGHGLVGMADRVTAVGGRLTVESPRGEGTLLAATLPLASG